MTDFSRKDRKRSSVGSKMPAPLFDPLRHRLDSYALAARAAGVAVLAYSVPATAAPVCKSISVELLGTGTYAFNPARQQFAPFNIAQTFESVSSHTSTAGNRAFFTPNSAGANELLATNGLPADLAPGARIGRGAKFGKGQSYGLLFTYGPGVGGTSKHHQGNFQFGRINYFGFKFTASGQTHYGWVRLRASVEGGHSTTDIEAYGYESTAGRPIRAGSCSVSDLANANPPGARTGVIARGSSTAIANRLPETAQPASLGLLALGANAVPPGRRK